jgi:hypothetical protein
VASTRISKSQTSSGALGVGEGGDTATWALVRRRAAGRCKKAWKSSAFRTALTFVDNAAQSLRQWQRTRGIHGSLLKGPSSQSGHSCMTKWYVVPDKRYELCSRLRKPPAKDAQGVALERLRVSSTSTAIWVHGAQSTRALYRRPRKGSGRVCRLRE